MTPSSLRDSLVRFARHPRTRRALSVALAVADEAAVTRRAGPRPWAPCLITLALLLVVVLPFLAPALTRDLDLLDNQHASASVEIAVNRAVFGAASHVGAAPSITSSLLDPGLRSRPLREWHEALAGSKEEYRRGLRPLMIDQGAFLYLLEAGLRLRPGATLPDLIGWIAFLQVVSLALAALALLRAGVSPALAAAAFALALSVCALVNRSFGHTHYALLLPFTLLLTALVTFAYVHLRSRFGWGRAALVFGGIGLFGGMLFNVRTSYGPLILALGALLLTRVAAFLPPAPDRPRARKLLVLSSLAGAFLAGLVAFDLVAIRPLRRLSPVDMPSHHVLWHPVVLAIALPPNDLARREGIEWLDAKGLELARRVDPGAELGPRYEPALRGYYFGLWKRHPGEMLGVYWKKAGVAGASACAFAESRLLPSKEAARRWLGALAIPLGLLPSGLWLFALSALLLAGAVALLKLRPPWIAPFPLAALASIAVLLYLESALIFPDFNVTYHAPWLLWVVLVPLILGQGLIDSASWSLHRRLDAR